MSLSSPGPDLSGARPGEAAVLLQVLSAAALPSLQTAPNPRWTQNPPSGAGLPSSEGMTVNLT